MTTPEALRQRQMNLIRIIGALCFSIAIIAIVGSTAALVTASRLNAANVQRREDLVSGCQRQSIRVEAEVLAEAGAALSDHAVATDPAQSAPTRTARKASSGTHWDAAAILASTLVDCQRAFPRHGDGVAVLDVPALVRVKNQLEQRFGKISPGILRRVGRLIAAYAKR